MLQVTRRVKIVTEEEAPRDVKIPPSPPTQDQTGSEEEGKPVAGFVVEHRYGKDGELILTRIQRTVENDVLVKWGPSVEAPIGALVSVKIGSYKNNPCIDEIVSIISTETFMSEGYTKLMEDMEDANTGIISLAQFMSEFKSYHGAQGSPEVNDELWDNFLRYKEIYRIFSVINNKVVYYSTIPDSD